MGNKRRRASIVILAVVFSAVALFTVAYDVLKRLNVSSVEENSFNAVTIDIDDTSSSATIRSGPGFRIYNSKLPNGSGGHGFGGLGYSWGPQMIIFSGQGGDGDDYWGRGAACIAFWDWDHHNGGNGNPYDFSFTISCRGDKMTGAYYGGGYTYVRSNMALPRDSYFPVNTSYVTCIAAGGGGGGNSEDNVKLVYDDLMDATFQCWGHSKNDINTNTWGATYATILKKNYNSTEVINNVNFSNYGMPGLPAFRDDYGFSGPGVTGKNSVRVGEGKGSIKGSGGGAGYYDGGGGYSTGNIVPGGGGVCSSHNCYALFTSDSRIGSRNPYKWNGSVQCYSIAPYGDALPQGSEKLYRETATLTPGGLNDDRFTPKEAVKQSGTLSNNGASTTKNVDCGIETAWVYHTRNKGNTSWGEWTTEVPSRTEIGTTEVESKYVIYASGDTEVIGPTYHMKYTDPCAAADDEGYTVITAPIVELTIVSNGAATAEAPTYAGTLPYTGADQHLITKEATKGTGAESITYYLKKDGGDWTEIGGISTDVKAKDVGTYLVKYIVKGTMGYEDYESTPKQIKIVAGSLTASPPGNSAFNTGDGANGKWTYDGTKKIFLGSGVSVTPSGGGTVTYNVYRKTSSSASFGSTPYATFTNDAWDQVGATGAGIYKVTYTVVSSDTTHYNGIGEQNLKMDGGSGAYEWVIGKADVTITKAPTPATNLPFNNVSQRLITADPSLGVVAGNSLTTKYGFTSGTYSSTKDQLTKIDPGSYTIYYKIFGNDNYNDKVGDSTVTASIIPVNIGTSDYTVPTIQANWTYNGGTKYAFTNGGSVNTKIPGTNTPIGQIQLKLVGSSTNYTSTNDLQNEGLKITNVGTYDVYYKIDGAFRSGSSINYNGTGTKLYDYSKGDTLAGTITVSAQQLKLVAPTVKASFPAYSNNYSQQVLTAAGSAQYSNASGTLTNVSAAYYTMHYTLLKKNDSNTFVAVEGKSDVTDITKLAVTSAGEYKVQYWAVSNSDNFSNSVTDSRTSAFTIGKKTATATIPSTAKLTNNQVTYKNGSSVKLLKNGNVTKDPDSTGIVVTYKLTNSSGTTLEESTDYNTITASEVGTYKIYVKAEVTDGASAEIKMNYQSGGYGTAYEVEIVKSTAAIKTNPPLSDELTYTGTPVKLLAGAGEIRYGSKIMYAKYTPGSDAGYSSGMELKNKSNWKSDANWKDDWNAITHGDINTTVDVWVYVVGDTSYNDSAPILVKRNIKLGQNQASLSQPLVQRNDLVYDNTFKTFLTEQGTGAAKHGWLMYKLVKVSGTSETTITPNNNGVVASNPANATVETAIRFDDNGNVAANGIWTGDPTYLQAKDAGDYKIYYVVIGHVGYNNTTVESISVSIDKASVSVSQPKPNTQNNLVYNGQGRQLLSAAPTVTGINSTDILFGGSGTARGTVKYKFQGQADSTATSNLSGLTKTNKGDYTIEYWFESTNSNYANSAVYEIKVSVTVRKLTVTQHPTANPIDLTYSGTSKQLLASGATASSGGKIQYIVNSGAPVESYKATDLTPTSAGTYTIKYKAVPSNGDTTNNESSPEYTLSFVIQPFTAYLDVPVTGQSGLLYNNSYQNLLLKVGTVHPVNGTDSGTLYYRVSKKNSSGSWEMITGSLTNLSGQTIASSNVVTLSGVSGWTVKSEYLTRKDVGEYKIEYKLIKKNNNFKDGGSGEINVSISDSTAKLKRAPTAKAGLIYNAEEKKLLNDNGETEDANGTLYYRLKKSGDSTYLTGTNANGWTSNPDDIVATLPGTYKFEYMVHGNNGYTDNISSDFKFDIVIAKGQATLNNANKPAGNNLTYNGKNQELLTNYGAGVNGTIVFKLYKSTNQTNTEWSQVTTLYNKNGNSKNESGWLGTVNRGYITAKDVGTYKITYMVVASNSDYYDNSTVSYITISVNKADPTYTRPTAKTGDAVIYTGESLQLINAGKVNNNPNTNTVMGTLWYRFVGGNNWTNDATTIVATNIGTYTIEYKVVGAAGYNDLDPAGYFTASITTAKAKILDNGEPTGEPNLVYDGTYQTLIKKGGQSYGGTILYRVKDAFSSSYLAPCSANGTPLTNPTTVDADHPNVRFNDNGVADNNGKWTSDPNAIRGLNGGHSYVIEYYVLGGVDAAGNKSFADTERYTLQSPVSISLQVIPAESYTAPRAKTGLKYTGALLTLFDLGSVNAQYGVLKYRLNSGEWKEVTTMPDALKAKAVDSYTISWYIDGTDDCYSSTEVASFVVTIGKADGTLAIGSLAAKTGLVYTGSPMQLFTGKGQTNGGVETATIYYYVSTSNSVPAATNVGSTDISTLTKTNAFNNSGTQYTYYLYYRSEATTSFAAKGWTKTNISVKIAKATYDVTVKENVSPTYDGVAHQIFAGTPIITSDSTALPEWITVTYKLSYVGFNGTTKTTENTDYTKVNLALDAGIYTLTATWVPNNNSAQINSKTSAKTLISAFTIAKSSSTTGIEVTGLEFTGDTQSITINGTSGKASPFNKTQSISLKINGETEFNGISSNNDGNYNQLSYCFVYENGTKTYTDTNTAASLNNAIKALTVNKSGKWHLWFKVKQHNSLTDAVEFKVATINVAGYTVTNSELTGITMTSSLVYDGNEHAVATGTLSLTSNIALGTISYAVNTDGSTAPTVTNEWKSSVAALSKQTNVGTYYLWVKWEASANIAASAGRVYGSFTISQLKNFSTTYFSGIDFNSPKSAATVASGYKTHKFTFSNANQKVINATAVPTVSVTNGSSTTNLAADFAASNSFKICICKSSSAMSGTQYTMADYANLVVKTAGTYYLWIIWNGNDNVAAGSKVYQINANEKVCFTVSKLTLGVNSSSVVLSNTPAASMNANKQYEFKYTFNETQKKYVGVEQSLFKTNAVPTVKVKNASYSSIESHQYLLTTASTVNDSTTGWVTSIEAAKQTNVATYDLWLKLVINDDNVSATNYIKLDTAKIIATTSFALIAPVANTGLITDNTNEQVLISASAQVAPLVEYKLVKDGESTPKVNWTTDASQIKARDAGNYKVYYRGAAYNDENSVCVFNTQTMNDSAYPFVSVVISPTNATITSDRMPVADNNVYYTGSPIYMSDYLAKDNNDIVKQGSARVTLVSGGVAELPLLYRWDGTDPDVYYEYNDAHLTKTNVGVYTLFFKPDLSDVGDNIVEDTSTVMCITVEIKKVEILINAPATGEKSFVYQSADYNVFTGNGSFKLLQHGSDTTVLTLGGAPITNSSSVCGNMGSIEYAVSTDPNKEPSDWKSDYHDVKIRQIGTYYPWIKVNAGDNHNAKIQCFANCKITITRAGKNSVRLNNSTYTAQKDNQGNYYHYNGFEQNLVSNVSLVVEIQKRNGEGTGISNTYNQRNEDDYIGTINYALTNSATEEPDENTDWHTNYLTLAKTQKGDYYLWIKFVSDDDSNFETFTVCLSGERIAIEQATASDLSVTGISKLTKMYNGGYQTLAVGDLTVAIKNNRYNLSNEINWNEVKYRLTKDGENPNEWNTFAETKAKSVGIYKLEVKLVVSSNNIVADGLIYELFNNAEITLADEQNIVIEMPTFYDRTYNGTAQTLIKTSAIIKLRTNNTTLDLELPKGTASYYISLLAPDMIDINAVADEDWNTNKDQLKQTYADTYYVWVKFAEGRSHTKVNPRYVGSVTIAQAGINGINLSGLTFTANDYNGSAYTLIEKNGGEFKKLIQHFKNTNGTNGAQLVVGTDYTKIQYGYSNDATVAPLTWIDEDDLANLKAINANDYYIWVKVEGTGNVADYIKCYSSTEFAIISKATLLKNDNRNDFSGIVLHEGLSYIAQNQVLADLRTPNSEGKLTIKINNGVEDVNISSLNENIVVLWGLGTGATRNDRPTNWTNDLSDINVQGMNAGDYYLWLNVSGSDNINEYFGYYGKITIAKAELAYTVNPGYYGDNIQARRIYTGAAQDLLYSAPVVKFHPTGYYYSETYFNSINKQWTGEYYDAIGTTIQYRYGFGEWNSEWGILDFVGTITGMDATGYNVYYSVLPDENWNWEQYIEQINVYIDPRDASDSNYGLQRKPAAKLNLIYNEKEQDLISYGQLFAFENGNGTALEGVEIAFWYVDANGDALTGKYFYYYDTRLGKYTWKGGESEKLPGRINAGIYYIQYEVRVDTQSENYSGNYHTSTAQYTIDNTLTIEIAKRKIWWEETPKSRYGLRYDGIGYEAVALVPGRLNVENGLGVCVYYTTEIPGTLGRYWDEDIPIVDAVGLWDVYYYVFVDDNNVFTGPQNNDPSMGTRLEVLVEKHVLSIHTAPSAMYNLMYKAEPLNLINTPTTSVDFYDGFNEENIPYFEYCVDGQDNWVRDNIQAEDRGEYTVYYRLCYNSRIFDFAGNIPETGSFTVTIGAITLNSGAVRAVYNQQTNRVSVEISDEYSDDLKTEFVEHARFEYRMFDNYNRNEVWRTWNNQILTLGTYQFRVIVQDSENSDPNFYPYTQNGAYDEVQITEDRSVYIIMPENSYSALPYVRAWIDFTGTMLYDDTPEQFRHEGWVNNSGDGLFCVFDDVNSTGLNGGAVLRIQTINTNNSRYYRSVDAYYVNLENRKNIEVDWLEEENYVYYYRGLAEHEMTVWLYEVYHIQYSGNGATLPANVSAPSDYWKWHGVDYLLEENVYQKMSDNNEPLVANGWNSNNGDNYPSGAYYRENSSKTFYANFFTTKDVKFIVDWVITDGMTIYRMARDKGQWFNAANYENRETGAFVAQNALITLPQVIEDEHHNQFWSTLFGNYYIKGWYAAKVDWTLDDGINGEQWKDREYDLNMTATRDVIFVAILASQTDKGIQCVFQDDKGNTINNSGMVAVGAKAYMALSGMDTATINSYREGYNEWVQEYGNKTLTMTPTGMMTYGLGAKTAEEKPTEKEDKIGKVNTWTEYMTMFVILGAGVIATFASLAVYITMRRRIKPINLSMFKEERVHKKSRIVK